ncbi:hypothetical protein [Saccharospirillum alexandrii]|uniref:hypothetical protein n=1 Tax=Saccharospirillum alexandrii TaxID=2448477 RepID=UPI000FD914BA|nr:hypothetical protein [Saccharospirillum alexandrii]
MKPTFLLFTLAATVTLAACDVDPQDGNSADNREGMNGLAVDGRIAGGKVWVDANNNNAIDDFEPYAFTDSDGYYSYNPLTITNYCALPVISDEYQRFCLIYGSSVDSMVIRIKGGTDLSTGERLKGVMAMSSTISSSSQRSSTPLVLSPITTLLQGANSNSDRTSIRSALGVTSDLDLRLDFSTASDEKSRRFLANSIAVQTMMDVLTSSTEVTDTSATQVSIINQISTQVAQNNVRPTSLPSTNIAQIARTVSANTATQNSIASRLSQLNAEIQRIETAVNTSAINAQLKASEVVSQLIKKEVRNTDRDAVSRVLDSGIANLSTSLVSNLSNTTVEFDIASITNSLVDAGKNAVTTLTPSEMNEAAEDAASEATLATGTQWGGSWFVLEATAEDSDDLAAGSYIALRLDGNADSTSGRIGTCVNVSAANPEDDDEVFENEYVGGRWSKLSDGVIQLSFDYEGQEFEGQMKAKAKIDGEAQKFRFTSDVDGTSESGDLRLNVNGQAALSSVARPQSAEDCASQVDSVL